jgi:predicted transcriptional regulator
MDKTTIQINRQTLERLKTLRKFERQSYDNVLNSMIDDIEEESLSEEEIRGIKQGLEDIKKGRVYSIESVAKELGITLKS